MSNYLDKTGLSYFWSKVKALIETHISNQNNPHNVTVSQIGAAAEDHSHNAADISAGTLPVGVVATNGTDYTVSRLRNIRASTTDLTAGTSPLEDGEIYIVYE